MIELPNYGPLPDRLAALAVDEELCFTAEQFSSELCELSRFDELVLRGAGPRFVGYAPMPQLPFEITDRALSHDWFAERAAYRKVGLWLLHLLFSGRSYAGLHLSHPESRLKTLWVYLEREELRQNSAFLHAEREVRYTRYDHFGAAVIRHPFSDADRLQDIDRPMFRLGWSDQQQRYQANLNTADQMIVTLSAEGLCALASLLMDFGALRNDVLEVNLETPFIGYAATQPMSIEARFWLPGSFGLYTDTLDEMDFSGMR